MRTTYGSKSDRLVSRLKRILYSLVGVLQFIIAIKIILELIGAPSGNGIVSFFYRIANIIQTPFNAIIPPLSNIKIYSHVKGISTDIIVDISAILAIIAYFLVAWLIIKITTLLFGRHSH